MTRALILGYGNPLRRDDGAGPEVARRIAALGWPEVAVIDAHQLLPEHATALAQVERAVFVDASVEQGIDAVTVRPVAPADDPVIAPHASSPEALLALAFLLFERTPKAWLVSIPAADLGLGEGLSDTVQEACREAVQRICALLDKPV